MSRDEMITKARDAIYAELGRQHDESEIQGAGYWEPEWGCCDGEPNWHKVSAAAVDAVLDALGPPF